MISIENFLFGETHGFIDDNTKPYFEDDEKTSFTNADGSTVHKYSDGTVWYYGGDSSEGKIVPDGSAYYVDHGLKREGKIFSDGSGYFLDYDGKIYQKCGKNISVWYKKQINVQDLCNDYSFINDAISYNGDEPFDSADEYLKQLVEKSVKKLISEHDKSEINALKEQLEQKESYIKQLKITNKNLYEENESLKDCLEEPERRRRESEQLNAQKKNKEIHKEKVKKKRKVVVFIMSIVLLTFLMVYGVNYGKNCIEVGYSSDALIGMNYEDTSNLLFGRGFTKITPTPIEDLTFENIELDNLVFEVDLQGETVFDASRKYNYKEEIIIKYHTLQKVSAPFGSKSIDNKNVNEVVEAFSLAGFKNITTEPDFDLITGWINSDGEVKSVSIGDEKSFVEDELFRPDIPVTIIYHAKK